MCFIKIVLAFLTDPPDVFVNTTNATVNDPQRTLICEASGFPTSYTYSEWTHTWPGSSVILRTNLAARQWTLTPLTYEDTGIYQCGASNGVARWNTVEKSMKGSVYLFVKCKFCFFISKFLQCIHPCKHPRTQ